MYSIPIWFFFFTTASFLLFCSEIVKVVSCGRLLDGFSAPKEYNFISIYSTKYGEKRKRCLPRWNNRINTLQMTFHTTNDGVEKTLEKTEGANRKDILRFNSFLLVSFIYMRTKINRKLLYKMNEKFPKLHFDGWVSDCCLTPNE